MFTAHLLHSTALHFADDSHFDDELTVSARRGWDGSVASCGLQTCYSVYLISSLFCCQLLNRTTLSWNEQLPTFPERCEWSFLAIWRAPTFSVRVFLFFHPSDFFFVSLFFLPPCGAFLSVCYFMAQIVVSLCLWGKLFLWLVFVFPFCCFSFFSSPYCVSSVCLFIPFFLCCFLLFCFCFVYLLLFCKVFFYLGNWVAFTFF